MNEHLSPEEFKEFSTRVLKGAELLTALDHLEECEECRLKIKSPSKAKLLEILFGNEGIGKARYGRGSQKMCAKAKVENPADGQCG